MRGRVDLARRALRLLPHLGDTRPDARRTVADYVEERAREHPDRPFLLYGDGGEPRSASWAELEAAANRVAWWALGHGLRSGDVVALMMDNRPQYLSTWIGLAKVGITTALINTNLSGHALRHALGAAEASTLICGTECLDLYATTADDLERPLDLWLVSEPGGAGPPAAVPDAAHDLGADLMQRGEDAPDPSVRDELRAGHDLFYIYTSGTTGLPKAARFSHARFLGAGRIAALALRMDPGDVHYCALPLYHSAAGAMVTGAVLASGATLALRRRFSAEAFWDDCRRFGATRFQYIGEFCRYLLNLPPRADDRDHPVRIALGNGLRPDIWQDFQERFGIEQIVEFYAATEGNVALVNLANEVGSVGRVPLGPLGQRLVGARLLRYDVERDEHARDDRGFCVECDPDETGELVGRISEKSLLRFEGYTSKAATEKKILRDVLEPGDHWFRTGDLLRRDRRGWFYFVDRIGDTFRWKGENVSTQEVAETLSAFPGLEMVNVYGVQIAGADGRAGMAALVASGGRDRFDVKGFFRFVEEKLPSYAAPVFLRLIDEAEVTGTLKLRKVRLQDEGFDVGQISDPVLVKDDAARSYAPLTAEIQREIVAGTRRL